MPISLPKIKIKNHFKDLSPEDRKILLVCLGVAFVFWILVKLSKNYTVHSVAYITYELPLGQSFTTSPPEIVGMDLIAKGWYFFLSSMVGNELRLHYQIPAKPYFELSAYKLQGDIDNLLKDKKVLISQLYFEGFNAQLEEQAVKRLPIVVPTKIVFAPEHALAGDIILRPDSVSVSGPRSQLAELTEWVADSLILNNLSQAHKGQLNVSSDSNELNCIPTSVEVEVNVDHFTEKSIFVPVQFNHSLADSIRFFPDKVLLKCVLGLGYYEDLKPADFTLVAEVDETLISEGKRTVALKLIRQPNFVRDIQYSPRAVEFFIVKE